MVRTPPQASELSHVVSPDTLLYEYHLTTFWSETRMALEFGRIDWIIIVGGYG